MMLNFHWKSREAEITERSFVGLVRSSNFRDLLNADLLRSRMQRRIWIAALN
jgi:hypothetical protein